MAGLRCCWHKVELGVKHKRTCVGPSLPPLCPTMSHLFHVLLHKALSFQESHVRKKNLTLTKRKTLILILPTEEN